MWHSKKMGGRSSGHPIHHKFKFAPEGRVRSSPAIADGVVYFGSDDTYLYAVDLQTGQEI